MRLLFTLITILLVLANSFAQDATKGAIQQTIDLNNLSHPYLYFNKSEVEGIKKRIKEDQESSRILSKLLAEANSLLYMPVDHKVPERGTHVRAGWTNVDQDNEYERKMRSYSTNAQKLAFVFQITGEDKYAQKAYEMAEVICEMPVWISQAHEFPIIYSRVMPWNVPDNQINFNFDIRTASLGEQIACVYDWTYEALNKTQRDRIRGTLLEKVVTPVRGDYEFHWWATSYRCNWTGVCNGGLGVTALALLKDHPTLIDVVAESYNRINKMMDELGEDGGWQEGGSYWNYGLHHATRFAIGLKRLSQGEYNLFNNQKLAANPVAFPVHLFIPPDKSVDFGDSRASRFGSTDLINLLTTETNSQEGAWYRNEILGQGNNIYDLIFPRPSLQGAPPKVPSRHFRTIDWWVMRSDFTDENKVTVAGKAGKNDDPHHGHLDIGHFILYWKGQGFIKDAGRPYYDEEYFDEARWDYPQAASAGHNVIMVNGEQQIPGKLKDQPFNFEIGGEVLQFHTSSERDYVLVDPSNAYPKKELKKWQRHIVLEKPNITIVLDDILTHSDGATVDVRFHSAAKEQVSKDGFILLNGVNAQMALLPLSNSTLEIYQGEHAYQPVHGTKPFEWLPYFGLKTTVDQQKSIVANLIVPVENEAEAKIVQSSFRMHANQNGANLRFKYRGERYVYSFVRNKGGLLLEE